MLWCGCPVAWLTFWQTLCLHHDKESSGNQPSSHQLSTQTDMAGCALQERNTALERKADESAAVAADARARAERAEAVADSAEAQLVEVTAIYAREVAQLKVRLLEKEAQLAGGFGNPAKLTDGPWSEPPYTPIVVNSVTGSERGPGGTHPFGFEEFLAGLKDTGAPSRAPSVRSGHWNPSRCAFTSFTAQGMRVDNTCSKS